MGRKPKNVFPMESLDAYPAPSNKPPQRAKPRDLWKYDVDYYEINDLAMHDADISKTRLLTTQMTAGDLDWFIKSPGICVWNARVILNSIWL